MRFWKKGKKEQFSDGQIEQIINEYMVLTKSTVGKYLPRRMRRVLNKNKGWGSLSASERKSQIQEIKQKGLGGWLEQATQETFEEISSFVSDGAPFETELKDTLTEFKKKWSIK